MASPVSSQPCDAIPKNPSDSASTSNPKNEGKLERFVSCFKLMESRIRDSINRIRGSQRREDESVENTEDNVSEGESESSNISRRIIEGNDIFYDIDTSRTGQDGFTCSTEYDTNPEIARLQKEFQAKQIAIKMVHERRMGVMRKRYTKQMEATYFALLLLVGTLFMSCEITLFKCYTKRVGKKNSKRLLTRLEVFQAIRVCYRGKNTEDDNCEIPSKKPYEFTETKYTGLCIIINNNTKYLREAVSLCEFFAAKGYEVEFHESLKKEEMESIFDSIKSNNFDNYGFFVCFVLSTGNDTYIGTADNLSIEMRKIVEYFNPNNNCPSKLKGKPKIFFFQNGIDFYAAKNLWEADDNETTPFPSYADAFVVRSTLRDFIDRFVIILSDHPGKSLSTIMALLQSETLPLFTRNEQYQVISTMAKEVYFAAKKSAIKTSNTRVMARIHAPMEKELDELTEGNSTAGPSSDNSNATEDIDMRVREKGSSNTTESNEDNSTLGPPRDISNATADIDMSIQKEESSDTTKPNEENSTVGPPNEDSNETSEQKVTTKPIAENSTAGPSSDDLNTTPGVDMQEKDSSDTKKPMKENSSVEPPCDDSNEMAEQEVTTKPISGNSTPVPSRDISTARPDVGTPMREEGSTNTTTIPKQDSTLEPPGDNSNGTPKQEVMTEPIAENSTTGPSSDDSNATPDVDTPIQGEESNEDNFMMFRSSGDDSNDTSNQRVTAKPMAENSKAGLSSDISNTTEDVGMPVQGEESSNTRKPNEGGLSVTEQ